MTRIDFTTLTQALQFVAEHGGPVQEATDSEIPDYYGPGAAYGEAYAATRLADGAYFIVEAFSNGPLSEVTPDEDFGVNLIGIVP